MNFIIEAFEGLDLFGWIGQIIGLLGFGTLAVSYLFKKKQYVILICIAQIFFTLESIFCGLWDNLINCGFSLLRNILVMIILYKYNRPLKKATVFIILGLTWVSMLIYLGFTNKLLNYMSYFPVLALTGLTLCMNSSNEFVIKLGNIINDGFFFAFYLIAAMPFSVFREAILLVCSIIGLIILLIKTIIKKKKIKKAE